MHLRRSQPWLSGSRHLYWTATTFRSGSAKNLVDAVEQKISSFPSVPPPVNRPSPVFLFTISKRLPSELLARLVKQFQSLAPSFEPIGVLAQDAALTSFSVSIATWSGLPNDLVPFTSTIASRTPIAVGREIIPPAKTYSHTNPTLAAHPLGSSLTTDYLGEAHQTNNSCGSDQLPIELRNIPPSSVKSLIFFSAPSPQPFLKALEKSFPSAHVMGLIGSSTVFQTGRRSTLFRNKSITGEEGAVGIAVLDRSNVSSSNSLIRHPGMKTFGPPIQVTQSKGNIILTLNSQKATRCLLDIIEKSSNPINPLPTSKELILSKKKTFYLGFLDHQNQIGEVCQITGGSTSRGTMSVDREREIIDNCWVQLVHFPENSHGLDVTKQSRSSPREKDKVMIEFTCNKTSEDSEFAQENQGTITDERKGDSVERIDGLFSASSEFGFIPRHQQIVDVDHSEAVLEITVIH